MSKAIRGFYWSNKAWYQNSVNKPEILFGLYFKDGGCVGEMAIRWHDLMGQIIPRLDIYMDKNTMKVLTNFEDIIKELPELPDCFTQEEFVSFLKKHDFEDLTAYEVA